MIGAWNATVRLVYFDDCSVICPNNHIHHPLLQNKNFRCWRSISIFVLKFFIDCMNKIMAGTARPRNRGIFRGSAIKSTTKERKQSPFSSPVLCRDLPKFNLTLSSKVTTLFSLFWQLQYEHILLCNRFESCTGPAVKNHRDCSKSKSAERDGILLATETSHFQVVSQQLMKVHVHTHLSFF